MRGPGWTGTLACTAACKFDAGGCVPPAGPVCGNDLVDNGEQCDGGDLGGKDCAAAMGSPYWAGDLACTANCKLDTTGCFPVCLTKGSPCTAAAADACCSGKCKVARRKTVGKCKRR